jgi:hypothetical protein
MVLLRDGHVRVSHALVQRAIGYEFHNHGVISKLLTDTKQANDVGVLTDGEENAGFAEEIIDVGADGVWC